LSVDCTCGDDGNNFYFSLLRVYDVIAMSHVLQLFTSDFYPTADRGAEYCGERVCLCVCVCVCVCVCLSVRDRIFELRVRSSILMHATYGHGSALLWRHSDIYMNEYFIYQHRYNTVKTAKSRTVSTGRKGSKSTYNCPTKPYATYFRFYG